MDAIRRGIKGVYGWNFVEFIIFKDRMKFWYTT